MTDFRDVLDASSFQQGFIDGNGDLRTIEVRYTASGHIRVLEQLHISAELNTMALNGFMLALVDHARRERVKIAPRAEPIVDWFIENPFYRDVLTSMDDHLDSNVQSDPVLAPTRQTGTSSHPGSQELKPVRRVNLS